MKERDTIKAKVKEMAKVEGKQASLAQKKMWDNYKKLRNKISNRIKFEEIHYKKNKFKECEGDMDKFWGIAKKFMEWESAGPPTQLEEEINGKLALCTKACKLANNMNGFYDKSFIVKLVNVFIK